MREHLAKKLIRIEEQKYLADVGTLGGHFDGFQDWVNEDYERNPDKYEPHFRELLDAATKTVWREKPKTLPLFQIGGVSLPEALTWPDKKAPGGFRKVASAHATTGQLRECAILTLRKGAEAVQKGEDMMAVSDIALERAGGDPTKLLSGVVDAVAITA
ncbi:hypothetical protein LCGC14_2195210 [marine sediment metagenome]|uniref:Uncharacterized protein n=1 Tax=marine sediment metagenome TaxID=412755 RepID=A0A0F9E5G3_9ZZZZ